MGYAQSASDLLTGYAEPLRYDSFDALDTFYESAGPTSSVSLLLRIRANHLDDLSRFRGDDWRIAECLESSMLSDGDDGEGSPRKRVAAAWERIAGRSSPWTGLLD